MPRPTNHSVCKSPGCASPFYGKGYCRKHYTRLMRGTDPDAIRQREKTIAARIEEKIERVPESGCWLWIGSVNNKGYGQLSGQYAHRVSYQIVHGAIPEGLYLLHSCDVPCCVNPGHLHPGTQKQNMEDAVRKGRVARGSRLPQYRHGRYAKAAA
jgi:hypothetical protein